MKLRQLKRRHDARTLHQLQQPQPWWAGGPHPFEQEGGDWDEEDDDFFCTRCGGSGYMDAEDPINDDCDEFGQTDCRYCHGTGEREHQTIF